MASLFTQIIKGDIPSYKIAENDKFYAFLDISPLEKGHTLVVPKEEIDYIFDLDDSLLAEFNIFSKQVAIGIKKAIPCKKVGIAVIGLEVNHAHIHLIPLNNDAINFSSPKKSFTDEQFKMIAKNISEAISL